MTSAFSRQLVARFTRPCIPCTFVILCRTLSRAGYALVVKALVATLPASIQDDVLPSPFVVVVVVWSQSLTNPTNGASSGTRDTCVPHQPDTCRAQCRRRARRTHGTLMVTVTDHVGARIFSSTCRSSRIHHRNSDTLARGVNNDCIRGLKLILSKGAPTIEINLILVAPHSTKMRLWMKYLLTNKCLYDFEVRS